MSGCLFSDPMSAIQKQLAPGEQVKILVLIFTIFISFHHHRHHHHHHHHLHHHHNHHHHHHHHHHYHQHHHHHHGPAVPTSRQFTSGRIVCFPLFTLTDEARPNPPSTSSSFFVYLLAFICIYVYMHLQNGVFTPKILVSHIFNRRVEN